MFIDRSERVLASLSVWFMPQARAILESVRDQGIPIVAISGRRTPTQQAALHSPAGQRSLHLEGLAMDVAFVIRGRPRTIAPIVWYQAFAAACDWQRARWGGDFSIPDNNHCDSGTRL